MDQAVRTYGPLMARLFLSQIFLLSAFGKITGFSDTVGYMASKGVPIPNVLLVGAIIFLLVGGLSVLAGFKARIGAVLLIIFLVLATYYFHNFWAFDPNDAAFLTELIQFQKNLAILGGLVMVIAFGSGPLSAD